MTALKSTVFSEYEVRSMHFIVAGDTCTVKCIGSVEEECEVIKTTKKCRGVVSKTRTRGTGNGTLKVSMHIPLDLFETLYGMKRDELAKGVVGYGRPSIHPEFCVTCDVFDEDDVEKFKAYPRCTMSAGPARKVENGAEEVAEVEAEIAFAPDENDYGLYEALASELDEDVKDKWLDGFTPALMLKSSE